MCIFPTKRSNWQLLIFFRFAILFKRKVLTKSRQHFMHLHKLRKFRIFNRQSNHFRFEMFFRKNVFFASSHPFSCHNLMKQKTFVFMKLLWFRINIADQRFEKQFSYKKVKKRKKTPSRTKISLCNHKNK